MYMIRKPTFKAWNRSPQQSDTWIVLYDGDILNATPSYHKINVKPDICKQSDSFHISFFSPFLASPLFLSHNFPSSLSTTGWRRNKEVEPEISAVYRLPTSMDQAPSWWLRGEESACQCRRHGFNPWVEKLPWRRKWLPTPVLLPEEFHGQRSLEGCSAWGCKS